MGIYTSALSEAVVHENSHQVLIIFSILRYTWLSIYDLESMNEKK